MINLSKWLTVLTVCALAFTGIAEAKGSRLSTQVLGPAQYVPEGAPGLPAVGTTANQLNSYYNLSGADAVPALPFLFPLGTGGLCYDIEDGLGGVIRGEERSYISIVGFDANGPIFGKIWSEFIFRNPAGQEMGRILVRTDVPVLAPIMIQGSTIDAGLRNLVVSALDAKVIGATARFEYLLGGKVRMSGVVNANMATGGFDFDCLWVIEEAAKN